ncbi:uncharacterized protein SPSK_01235 [Sporothrix schenckii 1099-18]|uniref:C6 transcription factor n=1 Tax=Sporothrix schenckii 1099-18 TaxID=1397361 RepID=A0A0F2LY34_SPOSC|nr:uncharacterized protein SPSK_01235 [Sporothrix schenckii 1099-18]KJR81400.1 hypothetical protein SPSK_01235 [Sporothrix schenckii 1099-18]
MVQTRSASGVDVPATPSGRPRSSGNAAPSTRKATGSVRSRKYSAGPNGRASARRPSSSSSSVSLSSSSFASASWVYVPDTVTLLWMAISLPLVIWDTGYVLLRPLTMPGGSLHWPIWSPYALYGEVDHIYGFKAWNAGNGFTAAQGVLNLIETTLYLAYVYVWWTRGQPVVAGGRKGLVGRPAAWAVTLVLSSAVMTLSKTVLYWLNEYFSGFDNIGQNDIYALIFLWIIPNGLWLVFPTYMVYRIGSEVIDVLASTADHFKDE